MTKKHYNAIANILAGRLAQWGDPSDSTAFAMRFEIGHIATQLSCYFAADNKKFDRLRFLTAISERAKGGKS